MPHAAFKLIPGVDENKTPALNEAAISYSQLIRFIFDRTLGGLVQKLGGWTQFYTNPIGSIVRCLWAWEDTNSNSYLAVGAEGNSGGSLQVISSGILNDITPQKTIVNVAVSVSTTSGSNEVTITDTGRNVSSYDVVDIQTQISVGGLVLFGQYQCYNPGGAANTYKIYAKDALGDPALATSTVANGGAVAQFATTIDSNVVSVTLNDHGYVAGETFPVLVATTVGGVTFYGNYIITSITSANVFVIAGTTNATSTTTGYMNSGNAHYVYYRGVGALPPGSGWGIGGYGRGGWGTGNEPVPTGGTPISAIDWTLDNWGESLIACPLNGPIYVWSPTSGSPRADVIPEAPPVNQGMFVAMPQRQIIAFGSTFTGVIDPLLIRWCDVDNYSEWIGSLTNQAGSYRIPKGSRIIQAIQAGQQGLVWTDLGIWAMQYAGPPYVYQFNELGTGCGLIGRKAAGSMSGTVFWMGQSQFYKLSGSGVEPIRCPIWDVIFQDLDTANLDKIRFAANSRFGEVSWFYPTISNGGEINAYVKYNIYLDQWDYGELSRTAWINESVLGPPIGAGVLPGGSGNFIIQHETSKDAVNASNEAIPMTSSFQTGYFVINEADNKMFIDQVWPDMKWGYFNGTQGANIQLTFYVTDYAGDTPLVYGPYTLTQATKFITPRFRGRLVSIKVESSDIGSFWRLGNIRYRFQPDGKY
jgi:hypothetical protein